MAPLHFPDYVLRREIVSRESATRIVPSRDERWAEPLDEAVLRVLSSDLVFVTGARPIPHPWFATEAPEASVRIAFERFELEEHARAVLLASWVLEDASGEVLHEGHSHIVRALAAPDGGTASLELSRALADLIYEIAAAWSHATGGPIERGSSGSDPRR